MIDYESSKYKLGRAVSAATKIYRNMPVEKGEDDNGEV